MGARVIVADANIVAYFFIQGPKTGLARSVRERDPHWIVPDIWRHEFVNILVSACLFAKLPTAEANRIWRDAEGMVQGGVHVGEMATILSLAVDRSVTAYDAAYVALAVERGVRCVTEDEALRKAFPGMAVSMSTFLEGGTTVGGVVRERRARYRTR